MRRGARGISRGKLFESERIFTENSIPIARMIFFFFFSLSPYLSLPSPPSSPSLIVTPRGNCREHDSNIMYSYVESFYAWIVRRFAVIKRMSQMSQVLFSTFHSYHGRRTVHTKFFFAFLSSFFLPFFFLLLLKDWIFNTHVKFAILRIPTIGRKSHVSFYNSYWISLCHRHNAIQDSKYIKRLLSKRNVRNSRNPSRGEKKKKNNRELIKSTSFCQDFLLL